MAQNPWLSTLQFKDGNGRLLHPEHPQAVRQAASLFAKLATGQRFTPEMLKKAVEQGRREAQAHTRKVSASKALGSGKSNGAAFRNAPENNPLREEIMRYEASKKLPGGGSSSNADWLG